MVAFNKAFWEHHYSRAYDGALAEKTIQSCHVIGLTSICLHDEPNNRIRVFFAESNHELWRNNLSEHLCFTNRMSLGVHPHRTDITLCGVFGEVTNLAVGIQQHWRDDLQKFKYSSAIVDGKSGLEKCGYDGDGYIVNRLKSNNLNNNVPVRLPAKTLHTIYVPKGEQAAWLVIEGRSDPTYEPICYTNNPTIDKRLYKCEDDGWATTVMLCILRYFSS